MTTYSTQYWGFQVSHPVSTVTGYFFRMTKKTLEKTKKKLDF